MQKRNRSVTIRSKITATRLSIVSTTLLILLMLIYLAVTLYSSNKLAEQTDIILNHPFEVVIETGNVRQFVSEMKIHTERLLTHNSPEDAAIVEEALGALYQQSDVSLGRIRELYLGPSADVEKLETTLNRLGDEQNRYLAYAALEDSTSELIEEYEVRYLYPLYTQATEDAVRIRVVAQERKVNYSNTADALRRYTLIGSMVLMSLMIGGLLLTQYVLHRQRRELIYRNELFDSLSLSIDDAYVICDAADGSIRYAALNIPRVLGIPDDEADAAAIYSGFEAQDRKDIQTSLRDPQLAFPYEKVASYTTPAGAERFLSVRIYQTIGGKTAQRIVVFTDRTDELRSQQALRDAMLNAEKANRAKSDFLSRMSHEIRTPLNAIIGMTTIAGASIDNAVKVGDCLTKINFSSKHLLMLVNDILDMSKIESNKLLLQNEPFDIFEVVNSFVSTVYPQAKAKGIEFEETMEGFGEHTLFRGDALRLNQILLNLSSNAVKFTGSGGKISLKVSRIITRGALDTLRFVLSDTGIGMKPEALDKIFKPFEQADATIAGRFGGTGLGMSITKNLVTLMSGRIEIQSEPGVGTTCIVDLPFEKGEEEPAPDFGRQALRALVVDDEQAVCEQTALLLEKIKIGTEWVLSGKEAVARVADTHRTGEDFDFCLIDWKMPDMDGIEATRRIRACVGPDIPIVMISSYDCSAIEEEALAAGVNGFLSKPLYRTSIYTAIKSALEQKGRALAAVSPEDGKPLAGKRLLMAEDNELNREVAQELLSMNGAEVVCAVNGREAVERFLISDPGEFDAILMDIQMPVMDGYEAARQIRRSSHPLASTIPIVATTANAFSDDIAAALAAGMNAHVSKPLDADQLCKVLAQCL